MKKVQETGTKKGHNAILMEVITCAVRMLKLPCTIDQIMMSILVVDYLPAPPGLEAAMCYQHYAPDLGQILINGEYFEQFYDNTADDDLIITFMFTMLHELVHMLQRLEKRSNFTPHHSIEEYDNDPVEIEANHKASVMLMSLL